MRLTIDASVIGDIMFENPRTPHSRRWLAVDAEYLAPDVLGVEVLSTATKQHRLLGEDPRTALSSWEVGRRVPVEHVPFAAVADLGAELAIRLRHPSTDCLYLATAIANDAPLVTADRRLYDVAVAAGLGEHVRWVEDPPDPPAAA